MTTVSILGAGKLGTVLGRLATLAGYRTLIAASGDPEAIQLVIDILTPGAVATASTDAARDADLIVLALPLHKYRTLPVRELAGKIVIDAMNYWPDIDGTIPEFESVGSSSEVIQSYLPDSRVVRAFSQLGYHQLDEDARPSGHPGRHALAIAGDDDEAVREVAHLVNAIGFDPVIAGSLADSSRFGPGTDAFGASLDRRDLESLLGISTRTGV